MLSIHTYRYIVSDGVISLGREFQMFGPWKRTVKYSVTIHLPPRPAVSYSVSLTSSCLMPYHGTCATNNEKPVEERHRPSVIIARGSHAPRVAFLMVGRTRAYYGNNTKGTGQHDTQTQRRAIHYNFSFNCVTSKS